MNKEYLNKVLGKSTSFFIALAIAITSLFTNTMNMTAHVSTGGLVTSDVQQAQRRTAPVADAKISDAERAMPSAREVNTDTGETAKVTDANEFLAAYRNPAVSKIELHQKNVGDATEIDITNIMGDIRGIRLGRDLQIDGRNFKLISKSTNAYSWDSLFMLGRLNEEQRTLHLKDVEVITKGMNYIDGPGGDGLGWQVILENVTMQKHDNLLDRDGYDEALRMVQLPQGHIFLRKNVFMQTSYENFIAGAITVEPEASVFGEVNYDDRATWWFDGDTGSISFIAERALHIGHNATVELKGTSVRVPSRTNDNRTYPVVYGHFNGIYVHEDATLVGTKPGHVYEFISTRGLGTEANPKKIKVFEGATIEGRTTGPANRGLDNSPVLNDAWGGGNLFSHFYAAPGSIVKFETAPASGNIPVIRLKRNGTTVELDRPDEYDLRNTTNRPGASAQVVQIDGTGVFSIIESDIEVWDNTSAEGVKPRRDFDGPADAGWYKQTFVTRGNVTESNPHNPNWQLQNYARISGMSGEPSLVFVRTANDEEEAILTDADKSYTIQANIFDNPASWQGQVTIQVTNDKDDTVHEGTNDKNGRFTYRLNGNNFFKAGTRYTAKGYRGSPAWSTKDPQASVTVKDVTPPTPVTIDGPVYHTANVISGRDGEAGAKLSATLNGQPLNIGDALVVADDGTWHFVLPANIELNPGDVIQVFLTDEAGNTTPTVQTQFRDAVFEAATTITVQEDVAGLDFMLKTPVTYTKGNKVRTEQFFKDIEVGQNNNLTQVSTNFEEAGIVNFDAVGAYIVNVTGTDRIGREMTKAVVVLIRDEQTIIDETKDTMITAYDFTLKLSDVSSADFVDLAHAQAWKMSTGEQIEVNLVNNKPTTGGVHVVAFTAGNTKKEVKATITDDVAPILTADTRVVYKNTGAKTVEAFLKDINASLDKRGTIHTDFTDAVNMNAVGVYFATIQGEDTSGNKSNELQVTVIVTDDNTIIDETSNTMLTAYDFALKLSDVPNADFVVLANARAWNITTGDSINVSLTSSRPTTGGTHDVVFTANGATTTVRARITDDIDPELTADRRVVYKKGTEQNAEGFLADAHATLDKEGTVNTDFERVVDLNKVGAYVVSIQGEDASGNKTSVVPVIVLVVDANTSIDEENDVMIIAYDFSLRLSTVERTDFVNVASAQAWRMSTGEQMSVVLATPKPTTGGVHDVVFNAGAGSRTVKATITDDIPPALIADELVIYDKGITKTAEQFLIDANAKLNKAGTITTNFADVVNLETVGVYIVRTQGEDAADNKSNVFITRVIVKDNNTVIDVDNDTMMTAHDFELNIEDVQDADFVELAKAQAWQITTGERMTVQLTSMKPTTIGTHETVFGAGTTQMSVRATVIGEEPEEPEEKPDRSIILEANDVVYSVADFKKLQAEGTLESETLNRAKARAYIKGTDEALQPLAADVRELVAATVSGGEQFDVTISYEGPTTFADDEADRPRPRMVIKVTIEKEQTMPTFPIIDKALPITGEEKTELVVGFAMSVLSLLTLLLIFLARRRKRDEDENEVTETRK